MNENGSFQKSPKLQHTLQVQEDLHRVKTLNTDHDLAHCLTRFDILD